MASRFADEVAEVIFSRRAPGLYPLKYAAAGFLRIRCEALRLLIKRLDLPLCNKKWGRGCWIDLAARCRLLLPENYFKNLLKRLSLLARLP